MPKRKSIDVLKKTLLLAAVLIAVMLLWGQLSPAREESHAEAATDSTATVDGLMQQPAEGIRPVEGLELPGKLKDRSERILRRKGYTCSYNVKTHCANYVAWHLTKERLKGNVRRSDKFMADYDIPEKDRVEWYDFQRTGYDRGHLCPAADNRWDERAMEESFLMTNICPQSHRLNEGVWNDLEETCRMWARDGEDIYVACGPIFDSPTPKTIGDRNRRVSVPDRFFKVVLSLCDEPYTIGFIYPNDDCPQPVFKYAVSVDEVERITGIDFFCKLDDTTEDSLEAECQPRDISFVAYKDNGEKVFYRGNKKRRQ